MKRAAKGVRLTGDLTFPVLRDGSRPSEEGERTEQGGPPSGDRKCGTGGDLAFLEEIISLRSMDDRRTLGDERGARSLGEAGEPRGRMRAGSPPAE